MLNNNLLFKKKIILDKNQKFFSIVTSVLNGERFLQKLISSIKKQKFKNFEFIVVDGGSKDNTIKIINKNSKFINKIILKKDNNMYEGIARGFKYATGKYFLWLNSDDFLFDEFSLQNLYFYLKKNNKEWVTCRTCFFLEKKKQTKNYLPLIYPKFFISKGWCHSFGWGFIQQENTVFSSKLYNHAGGIDTTYKQAGDFYLWKKFAKFSSLHSININFAVQRISNLQMTKQNPLIYFKEIKKNVSINYFYPLRIIASLLCFVFIKFRK